MRHIHQQYGVGVTHYKHILSRDYGSQSSEEPSNSAGTTLLSAGGLLRDPLCSQLDPSRTLLAGELLLRNQILCAVSGCRTKKSRYQDNALNELCKLFHSIILKIHTSSGHVTPLGSPCTSLTKLHRCTRSGGHTSWEGYMTLSTSCM